MIFDCEIIGVSYFNVYKIGIFYKSYVDDNSIQSIRYSPPFYAIQGCVYMVCYGDNTIAEFTQTVFYDYNRSLTKITNKIISDKTIPQDHRTHVIVEEIKKDSGMKMNISSAKTWSYEGNLIEEEAIDYLKKPVEYGSGTYSVANYFFEKYYNSPFQLPNS